MNVPDYCAYLVSNFKNFRIKNILYVLEYFLFVEIYIFLISSLTLEICWNF